MKTRLKEGKLKVAKLVRREAATTAQVRDKSDLNVGSSGSDGKKYRDVGGKYLAIAT